MKLLSAQVLFAAYFAGAFAQGGGDTGHTGGLDDPTAITYTTGPASSLPIPSDSAVTQTGCPTVIETASICSTCVLPACMGMVSLIQHCGCPEPVPTETVTYGCNTPCEDMGIACMSTTYMVMTEECATQPTSADGGGDEETTVTDLETFPTIVSDTDVGGPTGNATTAGSSTTSTTLANDGQVTVNAAAGRFRPFLAW